jgi:RNA polymerase sigma-70 factor (ECF subfamily)
LVSRGIDDGAPAEFRALFEAECAYVVHSLRRLGIPEADCPDLAHEVFIVVLQKLQESDRSRPMRPWLFGIAYRVALGFQRSARVRREVFSDVDARDLALLPDEALAARGRRERLAELLSALDLDRRAVLVLHDIDGHSMPEIAESLGIPLNTGYSRLRLARADLLMSLKRARGATDA